MVPPAAGWHDPRRACPRADTAPRRGSLNLRGQVHHADTYTPGFTTDDLKAIVARLRNGLAALLRQLTAQHVSGQWMEQHQRDAAKH
jgi:hypothetical protein